MPRIYRKVGVPSDQVGKVPLGLLIDLGHKTHIFYCDACLDQSWLDTEDDGRPRHFTGIWEEVPLEKCDVCGAVDQDTRDEYENWAEELNQQQWEEQAHAEALYWNAHMEDFR